jgi:hypothetical protein
MPADLPAGPALDELVAVQVMGWQRLPDSIDGLVVHRLYRSPVGLETSWVPPFSTTIAHAWEVVERMQPREVRIIWSREHSVWLANFDHQAMNAVEPTAPLAICRAALAAVQSAVAAR